MSIQPRRFGRTWRIPFWMGRAQPNRVESAKPAPAERHVYSPRQAKPKKLRRSDIANTQNDRAGLARLTMSSDEGGKPAATEWTRATKCRPAGAGDLWGICDTINMPRLWRSRLSWASSLPSLPSVVSSPSDPALWSGELRWQRRWLSDLIGLLGSRGDAWRTF